MVFVSLNKKEFPYFITYDFEAILQKLNRDTTKRLIWEEKHVPISVGVGSNVEEFKNSVCYISYDLDELLSQMIERMHTIANAVKKNKYRNLLGSLKNCKAFEIIFKHQFRHQFQTFQPPPPLLPLLIQ